MNESIFLCPACDKIDDYAEHEREISEQLRPGMRTICCVDWLEGRELMAEKVKGIPPRTAVTAWGDPYPGDTA